MRGVGCAMWKCAVLAFVLACSDRPSASRPISAPSPASPIAANTRATCTFDSPATDGDGEESHDNHPGRVDAAPDGNACAVADANLARVGAAIRAAKPGTAVAAKSWDKRSEPERMALVRRRLALQPAEEKKLRETGFAVLGRHTFPSYGDAFHEIFQSQLPIYISVDAILQAIYIANDNLIADLEDTSLAPLFGKTLDALACALPTAELPADTRRDLDLYLAIGRALLRGDAPHSMFDDAGVVAEATALVKRVTDASEMTAVTVFGRDRMIDFTSYTPRGHYTSAPRARYFRSAMWMSRIEWNLVSRSSRSSQPGIVPDPSETPREAIAALAVAELVERAGVTADVAKLDGAWALLAGRREDISVAQLAELRKAAGIARLDDPAAAAKLRAAIGDRFRRTARIHYMPEGSTELPAIATLLGPRVVPDSAATRPLAHGEVPGRTVLYAADMGYVLGHDRALAHLAAERAKFPALDGQLAAARKIAQTAERGKDDLYSAWLDGVMQLATPVAGVRPTFMTTPAYADLRLNSAIAGFGQIKHNYVLLVGESYFEGGCEIPDGYVEPAPAVYDALIEYATRGGRVIASLDPEDKLAARTYFKRVREVLEILRTIQLDELAGRALTADQKAFLSMVAEALPPGGSGGGPTYTGWWFDLHRRRQSEGLADPSFIASYFTGDKVSYIGATTPRLGVFVVDTNGAPRVVVGPVARAYEHHGPQARRLDDAAGLALPDKDRAAPWETSYTIAAPPPPPAFGIEWNYGSEAILHTKHALGNVTIEPLDHHRVASGKPVTRNVKPGTTTFTFPAGEFDQREGVHVQIGGFHTWVLSGQQAFGGWKFPEPEHVDDP